MNNSKGYTLPEVLIVMLILSILAVGSTSWMASLAANIRIQLAMQSLAQTLALARSEAGKRQQRVTLRNKSGHWENGWDVFADKNNNAMLDEGEQLIQSTPPINQWLSIHSNNPVRDYISYLPSGTTALTTGAWQAGTLTLCPKGQPTKTGYELTINHVGRVRQNPLPEGQDCPASPN